MASLGMGANVQSNGYFPGYYSSRDLVFDFEGRTGTSSNPNGELSSDFYHMGSLPVSSPANPLGYNKELLKQTILNHEAIFRDQIHELHRVYQRQRELMDEIKRNEINELHKNLRSEKSWSSSSLPSINAQKIHCSPNLPWSTAQPSVLIAENVQLPPPFAQEKSWQMCPAPASTITEESLKGCKVSESEYRKVGKKILDLQLPADEYIDREEGEGNERVTEVPGLSAYSLNGISRVVCGSHDKPYGSNYKGFSNLNVPFKLEKEAAAKSYVFGPPTNHTNNPFYNLSRRTNLGSQNFPNDFIQNLNMQQGREACLDNPQSDLGKKLEWLSSSNNTGQSGVSLDFAKVTSTEKQSVPVESLSRNLEQLNAFCQIPRLIQASSASLGQSSKPFMGISGFPRDELYQCTSAKSGPNSQNFLLSGSFCSSSKLLDLPSIRTNDPDNFGNVGSSDCRELRKYVKGSEDVGTSKNLNLNIMPAGCSDTIAFQSIQIEGEKNEFEDSTRGLHWLNEKTLGKRKLNHENEVSSQIEYGYLNPYNTGDIHALKLQRIGESILSTEKTFALDSNGQPHPPTDLQSLLVTSSEILHNQSKNPRIEEIEKECTSDVKSPCIDVPDLGEQIPPVEHLMKNVPKKHKSSAGIIDLNLCSIEDEDTPMDVDAHAPVSPENKECSPPRGESDEIQLEAPFQLADPEVQEEKFRNAAEALVSISSIIVANEDLQTTTLSSPVSLISNPLHWFAGIVSTTVDHLENALKADFSGKASDLEEFLLPEMDFFEFMTLQLTETKDQDYCYMSVDQTKQVGGSSSPTQPKKCRRRRKDFQNEVLPSLASLSRYEVTEDLQTIGGLVAAGRGRKRSSTSTSNITELLLNMKQQTGVTELGIEKMGLVSWEKACRKRRGQRSPNSNPQFFYELSI